MEKRSTLSVKDQQVRQECVMALMVTMEALNRATTPAELELALLVLSDWPREVARRVREDNDVQTILRKANERLERVTRRQSEPPRKR